MLAAFWLFAQVVPVDRTTAEFLDRGLLGATCVVLGIVVTYLWRDGRTQETGCKARETAYQARIEAREKEWQSAWQNREEKCQAAVQAVQAQRVADAQAVTAQLLRVTETCTAVLTRVSSSLETCEDAVSANKLASERLAEEIRRTHSEPRPGRYGP